MHEGLYGLLRLSHCRAPLLGATPKPRPSSYPLLGPQYPLLGTIYHQLRVQGGSWSTVDVPRESAFGPSSAVRLTMMLVEYLGGSQNKGYHFGGPNNKDYSILGSTLGSPYFGKLPCAS